MQAHNSCVTETQKYVEGATKAGGSHAAGFYDDAAQPTSVGEATGAQYLSKRPPWKCSICNVSCTSEATLVAHASGLKHGRRVRAADASANDSAGTASNGAAPAPAAAEAEALPAEAAKTAACDVSEPAEAAPAETTAAPSAAEAADKKAKRKREREGQDDKVAIKVKRLSDALQPANAAVEMKRRRDTNGPSVAPAKLARSNGMDHASGQLAQPALPVTISKVLAKRGPLSLARLVKLVRKKHWDSAEASRDTVLDQVRLAAQCLSATELRRKTILAPGRRVCLLRTREACCKLCAQDIELRPVVKIIFHSQQSA
jgi:Zinc-finger of C2H2 type